MSAKNNPNFVHQRLPILATSCGEAKEACLRVGLLSSINCPLWSLQGPVLTCPPTPSGQLTTAGTCIHLATSSLSSAGTCTPSCTTDHWWHVRSLHHLPTFSCRYLHSHVHYPTDHCWNLHSLGYFPTVLYRCLHFRSFSPNLPFLAISSHMPTVYPCLCRDLHLHAHPQPDICRNLHSQSPVCVPVLICPLPPSLAAAGIYTNMPTVPLWLWQAPAFTYQMLT